MNSRTLAELSPLAALLGLPTDTSKQYAFSPGDGWVEVQGGGDVLQGLIDGRWRMTTVQQDMSAFSLSVFCASPVAAAITTAFNGSLVEGGGWIGSSSGTAGAGITRPTANTNMLQLNTGTDATGLSILKYGESNEVWTDDLISAPATVARADISGFAARGVLYVPALSTSAQEFVVLMDFGPEGHPFVSNPTNVGAMQLIYQRTTSTNWRIRYCDTSGAVKYHDTGVAVAAGLRCSASIKATKQPDNSFVVEVDVNGTTSSFSDSYLNTSTWQNGADISRPLYQPSVRLTKTVGTTSVALQVRLFAFAFSY
jgi:hypothetical protein